MSGGFFAETPTGNFGNGTSSNTFSYVNTKGDTYTRSVSSVNTTITSDKQGGSLAPLPSVPRVHVPLSQAAITKPRLPGRRANFAP